MYILTIRTDKQEAEVGVFEDGKQLAYEIWQAHRELAETINKKIVDTLMAGGIRLHQLNGIAAFKGPGSFTGLRIGLTVANALAYSLEVPVVSEMGDDWLQNGIERLQDLQNETIAVPEYGAAPNITTPKH
ncbi:MAG TPA: tRNA (adenosine(37)-N6)-threonylcarbamoyltransferase complex dimerization subunit type 1 TsaB [Candidatus Saccharimonadales bacterium]